MEMIAYSISIKFLPSEMGALNKLINLDLSRGCIEVLPFELGLLRSLQRLDICYNKIKELPSSVGGLLCLEALHSSHNKMVALPSTLANIATLQSLDLSANMIDTFPAILCSGLGNNLVSLNLASNLLEFLPIGFAKFSEVQSLDLHHNLLRALPLDFVMILNRSLDSVNFSENPLDLIPQKHIFGDGVDNRFVRAWLNAENAIYSICCKEWNCNKDAFINCKLCVEEFVFGSGEYGVTGIKPQMLVSNSWNDCLVPQIKSFFFRCKAMGVFPCYHQMTDLEISQRQALIQSSEKRRDELALLAKNDAREEEDRLHSIYFDHLDTRRKDAEIYQSHNQHVKEKINYEVNVQILEVVEVRTVLQEKRAKVLQEQRFSKERDFLVKHKCDLESNLSEETARINPRRTRPYETMPCWKEKHQLDFE